VKKPIDSSKAEPIDIHLSVSIKDIADLLCSALEGGSNYWYEIARFQKPHAWTFRFDDKKVYRHIDYPLNPGGALQITSMEEPDREAAILNLDGIQAGLNLMAQKMPQQFANFMKEEGDETTGDVFLQFCLYGEVIYG
jgi:hypothetical protein